MTNCISNSFLCSNIFPAPVSYIDEAISEGLNEPIAEELEGNFGIAGSIIAGFVCTAIKIMSVVIASFAFLIFFTVFPCLLILESHEGNGIQMDDADAFSGPDTIVGSGDEISQGLEWVKTNVRKKRDDDSKVEYNRLEKLGFMNLSN